MRGIRAVDRIVELCERDLAFIWLTKGQRPRRDAFYDFKGKKLTGEILDELNYQFLRRLKKECLLTLKELFIDVILSILVDTFISKISLPMQPVPEIGSISVA